MLEGGSLPLARVRDGGNAKTRIRRRRCGLGADGASSLPPAEKVLPRVVQGLRGAQGLIFSAQGLLAPRILLQVCRSVSAPLGSTFLPPSMHDLPRTDARASAVASSARGFPSHNPIPTPFRLESAVPLNCRDVCAVVAGWVLDYGLCKGVVQGSAALSGLRVEIRGAMALEELPLEAVAIDVQV